MMNPDVKCLIFAKEIRLDLEEHIRKTEDATELAALVQAWCQVVREDNAEKQAPPEIQTSAIVRECMINILIIMLGLAVGIGFLMLLTRL